MAQEGVSPKLIQPWQGPYLVNTRINNLVYRIQLAPRVRLKIVHCNPLWCYGEDHPPAWLTAQPVATTAEQLLIGEQSEN